MEETFKVERAYGENGMVYSVEWVLSITDGVETATHVGIIQLENPVEESAGLAAVEAAAMSSIPASVLDGLRSQTVIVIENAAYSKASKDYPEMYFSSTTQTPKEREVRSKRDQLLLETDWLSAKFFDTGISDPAWVQYRQALRDITTQPGFPDNVIWPTKPE